jgi:hypothetical protein
VTGAAGPHALVVEHPVEGGLVDAVLDRDLAEGLALLVGLLGEGRGALVADLGHQRGDLHQRPLDQLGALVGGLGPVEALLDEDPRHAREQRLGLDDVAGHQRDHDVELELARQPADRHGSIVADHLRGHLADRLGDHRVDLARA